MADAEGVLGGTLVGDEPDRDLSGGGALADAGDGQLPQSRGRTEGRDGPRSTRASHDLGDAERTGLAVRQGRSGDVGAERATAIGASLEPWREAVWLECADGRLRRTEPGVGLLAHGISDRVARLRALGNAIVPQVAARILNAILRCDP
jgi:DNA (cytosine-5)-methyltransferase 1